MAPYRAERGAREARAAVELRSMPIASGKAPKKKVELSSAEAEEVAEEAAAVIAALKRISGVFDYGDESLQLKDTSTALPPKRIELRRMQDEARGLRPSSSGAPEAKAMATQSSCFEKRRRPDSASLLSASGPSRPTSAFSSHKQGVGRVRPASAASAPARGVGAASSHQATRSESDGAPRRLPRPGSAPVGGRSRTQGSSDAPGSGLRSGLTHFRQRGFGVGERLKGSPGHQSKLVAPLGPGEYDVTPITATWHGPNESRWTAPTQLTIDRFKSQPAFSMGKPPESKSGQGMAARPSHSHMGPGYYKNIPSLWDTSLWAASTPCWANTKGASFNRPPVGTTTPAASGRRKEITEYWKTPPPRRRPVSAGARSQQASRPGGG